MGNRSLPKILIVSRSTWDDRSGTSSTLSNTFMNYDPDKLAHIYIETKSPHTKYCNTFFQISEISLIKKIFFWRTRTGTIINKTLTGQVPLPNDKMFKNEQTLMTFFRAHRSVVFSLFREILWGFNSWKSKELRQFIFNFNPDIIWMDGSPVPLVNRLANYVYGIAQKPMVAYEVDDVYTYESCPKGILNLMYKFILRKTVKKIIHNSSQLFVISPKMKEEYDSIFKVKSIVLTKGIDFTKVKYVCPILNTPLRLVYLGQIIYGRIYSLIALVKAINEINHNNQLMTLSIYTDNFIPENLRTQLIVKGVSEIKDSVDYNQVPDVIKENDVLVFVESFEKKYKNVARLSFSTKLTDYLSSSKCVFAIGPSNIAPIEYLKNEDAAIVVDDLTKLQDTLERLLDKNVIIQYSKKAFKCAEKNHDLNILNRKKMDVFFDMKKMGKTSISED